MPRMFSASYQRYSTSDGGTEGRGDAGTLLGSKILRSLRCTVRPNKNMPIRASRRLISSNLSTRTTFLKRERVVGLSAFLWSIALDGRSCERVDRVFGRMCRPARLLLHRICIYTGTPNPTKLESPRLRPRNR